MPVPVPVPASSRINPHASRLPAHVPLEREWKNAPLTLGRARVGRSSAAGWLARRQKRRRALPRAGYRDLDKGRGAAGTARPREPAQAQVASAHGGSDERARSPRRPSPPIPLVRPLREARCKRAPTSGRKYGSTRSHAQHECSLRPLRQPCALPSQPAVPASNSQQRATTWDASRLGHREAELNRAEAVLEEDKVVCKELAVRSRQRQRV